MSAKNRKRINRAAVHELMARNMAGSANRRAMVKDMGVLRLALKRSEARVARMLPWWRRRRGWLSRAWLGFRGWRRGQ